MEKLGEGKTKRKKDEGDTTNTLEEIPSALE